MNAKSVLVCGGTGHAKVLRPIVASMGLAVVAVYDRNPEATPPFPDVLMLSGWEALTAWINKEKASSVAFVIAIGGERGLDRCEMGGKLSALGLCPLTLVHERAWVAPSAVLSEGCQILAMAAVSESAQLGPYCIVNTNASVDHECQLGAGVHVMPGATLAGCVSVGDYVTIGSNATVLPRLKIGERAIIGAGAVVTKDVLPGKIVVGSPARPVDRYSPRME